MCIRDSSKSNLHSVDASVPLVKLDRPMIHGWDDSAVKRWQQQVADVLSLPIRRQLKLMGERNDPEMVLIPPGRFLMGSPSDEHGRNDNERQHEVAIDGPFYMGIYPITFDEYDLFCDNTHRLRPDDEEWGRGKRPVINVEYEAVLAYCEWASDFTGCNIRPASETEWEYACRAGSATPYHFGSSIDDQLANYDARYTQFPSTKGRFRKETCEVGSYPPNAWGLFDMHGNVCEWTRSRYSIDHSIKSDQSSESDVTALRGASLVLRGGGWNSLSGKCRSSSRQQNYTGVSSRSWGFRVCCDLPVNFAQR